MDINLRDPIKEASDFIFIVIALTGIDGKEITFDNSIYDFSSPESLEMGIAGAIDTSIYGGEVEDDFIKQLAVEEKILARNEAQQDSVNESGVIDESEEVDLSAAGLIEYNVAKVAQTSNTMPST